MVVSLKKNIQWIFPLCALQTFPRGPSLKVDVVAHLSPLWGYKHGLCSVGLKQGPGKGTVTEPWRSAHSCSQTLSLRKPHWPRTRAQVPGTPRGTGHPKHVQDTPSMSRAGCEQGKQALHFPPGSATSPLCHYHQHQPLQKSILTRSRIKLIQQRPLMVETTLV